MGRLWLIHNTAKCLRFQRNEQSYNREDKTDGTMKKLNNDGHKINVLIIILIYLIKDLNYNTALVTLN